MHAVERMIRIYLKAMMPITPKPMSSEAGPPFANAPPAPISSPGPIIPARAIMLRWRVFSPRFTPLSGSIMLKSSAKVSSSEGPSTRLGVFGGSGNILAPEVDSQRTPRLVRR